MSKRIRKHMSILIVWAVFLGLSACTLAENSTGEAKPIQATVIEIEKFGHTVLDITTADFIDYGYEFGDVVDVRFDSQEFKMPFFDGYYSTPGTEMLRGLSAGKNIAICINYGDFSKKTGIANGDRVEITMAEEGGMRTFYELSSLKYSDNRADYSDDVTFANFRAVTAGNIGDGKLYRSASPINNEHGRAGYANALIEEAGVATVLNLADSEEDIEEYCATEDFTSEYYRTLYGAGHVMVLDLNINFYSDEFNTTLIEGLCFLAQNDPPYSIHCTEGKDRAGFTAMLLEAMMGAELQEIIDDYMLSFYNYYGVDKEIEPDRYEIVLDTNLFAMLYHMTGTNTPEELAQTDLQAAATDYLLKHGMNEREILILKDKLR